MTELQKLKVDQDAAISREREALQDWSSAAKKWCKEREQLRAQLTKAQEREKVLMEALQFSLPFIHGSSDRDVIKKALNHKETA